VVISGAPDLGVGSVADQAQVLRERFDWFRTAVINEPRGHEALVGALIVPTPSTRALCGVIFFNNVGLLHACGHGTIGLATTLAHLGRIQGGTHVIETPVGEVKVALESDGAVTIENVPSYRSRAAVEVEFEFDGRQQRVLGDVAWGGNWFFLVANHGQELHAANLERLSAFAWALRQALEHADVRGAHGAEIDHIELFGPPTRADCDSKNFVLCPGKAYDRSPCGTGTSAKMACLFADGKLEEGGLWRQESIIGSRFLGRVRVERGQLVPSIRGHAFVTGETRLRFDERDPFRHGLRFGGNGG
jgi:4-hydroxyproline epimerase